MPSQPFRSRLYLIVGSVAALGASEQAGTLREQVAAALAGGAGCVQYHGGHLSARQMVDEAAGLVAQCRRAQVPLVVRGRVDVALAATAEGVHVDADDVPVAHARRLMGPRALVGVSVSSIADALEAQREGASYVAIGPVFGPAEVPRPLITPQTLREYAARVGIPICIMGGITLGNVEALADLPAALIGVNSAVISPRELEAAAGRLVRRLSLA